MKHIDFVHLHNHSDYSLLDGASPIPGMVARAAEMRMPALALTDHGAMFGAVEFYQEARKAGVKPIVGMEAYVTRGSRHDRKRGDTAHHLVLLARDEEGFRNLMRLSSLAYLEGFYYKPRVDHEILAQHAKGLVALSACPKGEIADDLLADRDQDALRTAMTYRDLFGPEHFFLEIQNHGLDLEAKIREKIRWLARETGLPIVATNDCHYLSADHVEAQDLLICIQTGKTVNDAQRMRALANLHFRSLEEMREAFRDFPEALPNTIAVAERCNLQMNFGKPLLPEFPLPEGWRDADSYFRDLAWKELHARLGADVGDAVKQRFAYELDVICTMGFASYFLIVRDFIDFAKRNGIGVGPGRGSVAGSLVAYALRITDVDPLKHQLIFERFLNPERVSMPDIDIDFDDLRRPEVIRYVREKYGEGNVTQIITFGTMGAKGVVRDVGRALGLPFADVDKVAKLVPDGLGMTLERALELSPDLKALPGRGEPYGKLLKAARVLEGLARHASTHAAGVLITPGPLLDYVPLYRQKDESVTTQWDMKSVEKAGLLKMDFLGLRTLSVLQECGNLVKARTGTEIDLQRLPENDPAAFKVFQDGDTVAIFQFESSGMRDYLKKLKPTVFEDLVAMNALYRPGPMENIPYFIDCKHGRQVARYDHAKLEPILKGTYGVFVYQEQVMAAAHELAGFSMAQADELRRAMGKKIVEEMAKKRDQFVEGCGKASRIPPKTAEKIFATMEKFAGYGFNKCLVGETRVHDVRTGSTRTLSDLAERGARGMRVAALGADGRFRSRRVLDVLRQGRQAVHTLTTRLGHEVVATANHPFRTLEGWKRLDELRPGDRIAAPRRLAREGAAEVWPEHEVIALAHLLAEGNTCHPTTLYFYSNDRAMVADFREAIEGFPDTVARVSERAGGRFEVAANLGPWVGRVGEGSPGYATWTEGSLACVADAPRRSGAWHWAGSLGLLGRRATGKRIPPEVFALGDDQLALFLGRLWSGDGFVCTPALHAPYYATSSADLARDVQAALLRLGLVARRERKSFRYRGGVRTGWVVRLLGTDALARFVEVLGPHLVGRSGALQELRRYVAATSRDRSSADTLPPTIASQVDAARRAKGWTWAEVEARSGVCTKNFIGLAPARIRGFRRSTIRRLAQVLQSPALVAAADTDVFWDTVTSITPAGEAETFDLTIEGDHNFVADGLVVHNSHSAAYALVAYQCAWLKAHHPAEFMAATMTSEMSDSSRIQTLVEESRRQQIALRPPDVNRSAWKFSIDEGAIRIGLGAVRNVGQSAAEAMIGARAEGGDFRGLFDLASRVPAGAFNRRTLESLCAAGACDAFGAERGQLFAGAALALDAAAAQHRADAAGQSSLFGDDAPGGGLAVQAPPLPPTPEWTPRERSAREKEMLGFYLTEHPLEPLRDDIARIATHGIAAVPELGDGAEVRVVGIVGEIKQITTRAGKLMAMVVLEDLTGRVECTLFPEPYEAARAALVTDAIVIATGRVEVRDDRGAKLLLNEVRPWDVARESFQPVLHVELKAADLTEDRLLTLDEVLAEFPGESDVILHLVQPDHARVALRARTRKVRDADPLLQRLRDRIPGCRVRWGKGAP